MKKIFTILAFISFVSGCASVATRTDNASDKKYTSVQAAVQETTALTNLIKGKTKGIQIKSESPYMLSNETSGRFEVVQLQGTKDEPFTIIANAKCDCWGFRKWSVMPIIYVTDNSGNVIVKNATPGSSVNVIQGTFPQDGKYSVLIGADEKSEGRVARTEQASIAFANGIYIPNAFTVAIKSHPTGDVDVTWAQNAK